MSEFVTPDRSRYPDNALDGFEATPRFKLDNARAMMWLSQLAYETASESKVPISERLRRFNSYMALGRDCAISWPDFCRA